MTSLHDIAPLLAKARDQRVAELHRERAMAGFRRFQEACEALGRSGVRMSEAMRQFHEVWTRQISEPRPKKGK